MCHIVRTPSTNYFDFSGIRMSLDVTSEHALMSALTHRETTRITDADGQTWELAFTQNDEFQLSPLDGPVVATLKGAVVRELIQNLRAIILGA